MAHPARQPESIRPQDLAARLAAGEPIQLVDVREEAELALARLPQPVLHLPLSRSAEWMAELPQRLERDRPVAVLCHAGVRSWHFGCWLIEQHAYEHVWNVQGGIDAWSVAVDPTVPRY
ncbi:MAG: rhodanese-like domain-containing protein [Synechococcaceae cyanobacterium]|jgi:rhodanese-related sulfurtransferase|nr:rhodanese-like domain-containing protein [Synechococcaceae cyanobacterium]